MRLLGFAVLSAFFVVLGLASCGPSFQAVYEGDVRFEHCYALDESVVPSAAKQECWRGWLHSDTYGQSRDRVEYAATRFSQLSLGPTLPSEEARDTRPRRVEPNVAAPMPTNAFAPPPNLATSVSPSASAGAPTRDPRAPGADCSEGCKQHWGSCREGCKPGETRCEECDRRYRACVSSCMREEPAAPRPPRGL